MTDTVSNSPIMLAVSDLHAYYGKSHILQGVSFHVGEGEIVSLLGRNGVGRSTTCKAIMGEVPPTGSIQFKKREISGLKAHQIARFGIGYVPENRDIFPTLTVRQNLTLGMKSTRPSGRWRIEDMFQLFPNLEARADVPGGALSGGEQQILALARCLVRRPKLVLLDEPTEGIQPSIVDQIAEKLEELAKALGLTVLLVEQDLHFIASLSSRVLIIQKGSIVAEITPDKLSNKEIVDEYLGI